MDEQLKNQPASPSPESTVARPGDYVANALRYWERRRPLYNGVLALVIVHHFILAWPGSRDSLSVDTAFVLFILAVLANVCYCSAYVADFFLQFSGLRRALRTGRMVLLLVGIAFGAVIARYAAQAMFGS